MISYMISHMISYFIYDIIYDIMYYMISYRISYIIWYHIWYHAYYDIVTSWSPSPSSHMSMISMSPSSTAFVSRSCRSWSTSSRSKSGWWRTFWTSALSSYAFLNLFVAWSSRRHSLFEKTLDASSSRAGKSLAWKGVIINVIYDIIYDIIAIYMMSYMISYYNIWDIISWYHVMPMISQYDIILYIWYHIMISLYDIILIIWYHIWYHVRISFSNSPP